MPGVYGLVDLEHLRRMSKTGSTYVRLDLWLNVQRRQL